MGAREIPQFSSKFRVVSTLRPPAAAAGTDLPPGGRAQVVPEAAPDDANSPAVLVRLRQSGQVRAYSRICAHAGCAVCVFLPDAALLVCPWHRSTFDAAAGGRGVSGPASQPLPELPLDVDAEGRLVATGDFDRSGLSRAESRRWPGSAPRSTIASAFAAPCAAPSDGSSRDRPLAGGVDSTRRPVGIVSLGDLALERDPHSVLGHISAAPPNQ
jgi:nitrite reductase/ring-hydroxylating ferredoxin subunit